MHSAPIPPDLRIHIYHPKAKKRERSEKGEEKTEEIPKIFDRPTYACVCSG
jgi:hypothetical protein